MLVVTAAYKIEYLDLNSLKRVRFDPKGTKLLRNWSFSVEMSFVGLLVWTYSVIRSKRLFK